MEIEGHPTQDLIDELERRGALPIVGTASGPDPEALVFLVERLGPLPGSWLFVPGSAFETGFDDPRR